VRPLGSFRAGLSFQLETQTEPPTALAVSRGSPLFRKPPPLQPFLTIGGGGCGGGAFPLPIGRYGSLPHPAKLNAARAAKTVQTNDFMTPPAVG
jgi:hypothetical protein